jgi:hypothetical protein
MSKTSRRKKPMPVKRKRVTFRLTVEAQEMIVSYEPHWIQDVGHFEFRSPHEPPRRIPVSETGYRSHFAPMDEVEASASPQDYAREVALVLLRVESKAKATEQLSLF